MPTFSSQAEQIEYYLGKDNYRNKYFKPSIPEAWEIEFSRPDFQDGHLLKDLKNKSIVVNGIELKFNNLGYRANYDYNVNDLLTKKNILVISDCFALCQNNHYDEMWTTKLQNLLPEYNLVTFGFPGWAFDTIARVGASVLQALAGSVEYVLVITPNEHQREFVSKQYEKIVSAPHAITNVPYEEYWDHIDWKSNNYNFYKNYLLLKSMTEAQGGRYIGLTLNYDGKSVNYDNIQLGEYTSVGPNTYQALTNWFYKKIKNLPSKFDELTNAV